MPEVDTAKLEILPGTFRVGDKIMAQLQPQNIGPIACGVVLTDITVAEPFLRSGVPVSNEPLALLVPHASDLQTKLPHGPVTVPCRCVLNNEPVLFQAVLVQIGKGLIQKHSNKDVIMLEPLDVVTVKLMVYRDETDDWSALIRAPTKYLASYLPCLSLCPDVGCKCNAWHCPDGVDIQDPILDLWRRQWLTNNFKPAKASEAAIYSCCLRVPQDLQLRLLEACNAKGIYGEPRQLDGKAVDDQFVVIWTPKLNAQELNHFRQTRPHIVGLARAGDRRGVRVEVAHAPAVHVALRPGVLYLPPGPRQEYVAGPFPFGCDRNAVAKTLEKLNWQAKPLQPLAPVAGKGSLWTIAAVDPPPDSIFETSHGEILVSLHKTSSATKPVTQPSIATASTLELCGSNSKPVRSSNEDLLQTLDPWKGRTLGGKSGPVAAPPSASETLRQMEDRIRKSVIEHLPTQPPDMVQDDVPDRVQTLEAQVQQLVHKQSSLEHSFADFSGRQTSQLASVQTQLNQTSQQLHGHIESSQQSIQAMFASQMEQIRGLLSKRSHGTMEWLLGVRPSTPSWVFGLLSLAFSGLAVWGPLDPLVCFTCCLILVCTVVFCHRSALCALPMGTWGSRLHICQVKCVWIALLVLTQVRIGEALHPGPPGDTFIAGCCNPSGLGGKAALFNHSLSHGDCWAVSESHLSSKAMFAFKAGLKFEKSPFRYVAAGFPVQARAHSAVAGGWRGVAVVSKQPTRAIPVEWSDDVARSSRAMVSATCFQGHWLITGVVYGEPEGPAHPRHKQHTEILLHTIASHVCHLSVGLRMVCGDWNVSPDTLPAFGILRAAGFRDIQEVANDRWGTPVQPTCKQRTLRDYCFLSPELQQLLLATEVHQDIFADHAVLQGTFQMPSKAIPCTVWRQPQPFAWPKPFEPNVSWDNGAASASAKYAKLWDSLEQQAKHVSPVHIPKGAFGRGREAYTKDAALRQTCPVKVGRAPKLRPCKRTLKPSALKVWRLRAEVDQV